MDDSNGNDVGGGANDPSGAFGAVALLGSSVDDIKAGFDGLSNEQLSALHVAEKAGKKRVTLLAAIDAEVKARALDDAERRVLALAGELGITVYTVAQMRDLVGGLEQRIAVLEGGAADVPADAQPLLLLEMAETPVWPLCYVAFTDEHGALLADLPPLQFEEGAFQRVSPLIATPDTAGTFSLILSETILIPEGGRRTEMAQVWLLDSKRKGVAVCRLLAPLPVGGGTSARLAAGSLRFDGVRAPEPEPEPEPASDAA